MLNYSIAFIHPNSFNVTVYSKSKCELAATWHSTSVLQTTLSSYVMQTRIQGIHPQPRPLRTFLFYILADSVRS